MQHLDWLQNQAYVTNVMDVVERVSEDIEEKVIHEEEREGESRLAGLLHSRADILRTKLAVLASEIRERLQIRDRNIAKLYVDRQTIYAMLRRMQYRAFEPRDLVGLYLRRLDILKEHRQQDVECWKDVAMVMRDFLMAFEAAEEAKAEVQFLGNVGRRT